MAHVAAIDPSYHLALKGEAFVEPSPRWIRVKFNGETIADSKRTLYVSEPGHLGDYFFPRADVRTEFLTQTNNSSTSPSFGTAHYWTLQVGDKVSEGAAWVYTDKQSEYPDLSDYIAFRWNKVDQWFEEDEEVFVHPRNPYHRIDVAKSTRHVEIVIAGKKVVDTHRPSLLWETSLPPRYYIDPADVNFEYLEATDSHTRCPYKGIASYWSFRSGDLVLKDIAWSYQNPIDEAPEIKGLIAFYNERVDGIYVDGELQPIPKNQWSNK